MSKSFKLCLLYLILITWNRAGHAEGYGIIALYILGLAIIWSTIGKLNFWKKRRIFQCLPIISLIVISIIGWFNPYYRSVSVKDLEELEFEKTVLESKDSNKVEMVSNAFKLILNQNTEDPSTSLSLFFYFKNTYLDRFLPNEGDSIKEFFINCEKKIKLPLQKLLPSCTINSPNNLKRIYFFSFNLFIGIAIFYSLRDKTDITLFLHLMVINCLVLCLVGFYQKINHQWTDDYLEILGIWNAPEPRYYFSTFTYKNHWSAYAIITLFFAFYLLRNEFIKILNNGTNIISSKIFIYLSISIIIIASSILFSGSRSGTLLLILSFIICSYEIYKSKVNLLKFNLKYLFNIFLFMPILFFLFYTFKNDKKFNEMVNNSTSQWQNLVEGKLPMRILFWNDTIDMIQEKPFWGYGYNSYSSIYPKFQSTEVRYERALGLKNAHNPYIPLVAHAHNDVLEFLVEWGFIGVFLIFLPFLLPLLRVVYLSTINSSSITGWGCIVFLLYCFIDFPTRTPACLATFCALLAVTFKIHSFEQKDSQRF